jgi:signal peptidase I
MKCVYSLPWLSEDQPRRWEVVVFHYPEEPETNYIKRLVGLPNEHLRIMYGDVLRKPMDSSDDYRLLRKPLEHLDAMLQNVYDDRHRPKILEKYPEWRRWTSADSDGWSESGPASYTSRAGNVWSTLRYQHLVPDPPQARELLAGRPAEPRPRLISDFYAYNSGTPYSQPMSESIAPHWVGDLAIRFQAETKEKAGALRVTLVEAGVHYHCEIDLNSGEARMFREDDQLGDAAATALKNTGRHEVRFANIDGRLTLWVDGATPFGEGVLVQDGEEGYAAPTAEDLEPVRIASRGASVTVSDLVLSRDIYYTLTPGDWDYTGLGIYRGTTLSDPHEFPLIANMRPAEFEIRPGSYMMLGDNSPRSKDGRGWSLRDRDWDDGDRQAWEVPEKLLIGKAFFIYWPHGKPFWPNIPVTHNLRLPFRPNVERMKWIR